MGGTDMAEVTELRQKCDWCNSDRAGGPPWGLAAYRVTVEDMTGIHSDPVLVTHEVCVDHYREIVRIPNLQRLAHTDLGDIDGN
ncbi:MAG: hypothetical protein GY809_17555 [Planctomycetes bacterium]|nr:hypothetical protein [Planctomycetota bacterium]